MKKSSIQCDCTLYSKGMHCPSCELLVEGTLKNVPNVIKTNANHKTGIIQVTYSGQKPDLKWANNELQKFGYHLSYDKVEEKNTSEMDYFYAFVIVIAFVLIFLLIEKSGLSGKLGSGISSSPVTFFLFGIAAGFSSCAALVGGLLLSIGKKWNEQYKTQVDTIGKLYPYIVFNGSRLLSFAFFGGLLGLLGTALGLSIYKTALLLILISGGMVLLGLQMVGVKWARGITLPLPKSLTGKISDTDSMSGKLMPAVFGGLTFFLPCGFTLLAQSAALASSSFLSGSLIMGAFALGTLPILSVISYTNATIGSSKRFGKRFSIISGMLIIMFALYTINTQLIILNAPHISLNNVSAQKINTNLAPVTGDVQIMNMEASASEYTPNTFKIKAGVKTKWIINDTGTSGCTRTLISQGIIDGYFPLRPGENVIEFIAPSTPGTYAFSCSMGMVSGSIEVL